MLWFVLDSFRKYTIYYYYYYYSPSCYVPLLILLHLLWAVQYLTLIVTDSVEGGVCGSWEKGSHLGSQGARPARRGKRRAVGFRQWRRIDAARWPKTQETGSPHLQETFMHRASVIVHCVAVVHYNHNRNRVLLYYLFQENKSFGTGHHLHSFSDLREVVSSPLITSFFLLFSFFCLFLFFLFPFSFFPSNHISWVPSPSGHIFQYKTNSIYIHVGFRSWEKNQDKQSGYPRLQMMLRRLALPGNSLCQRCVSGSASVNLLDPDPAPKL